MMRRKTMINKFFSSHRMHRQNVKTTMAGLMLIPVLLTAFILLSSSISFAGTTTYLYDDVNHVIHIQSGGGTPVITATAGANGSISPTGSITVSSGGNQTFTIAPNSGYQVASVTVDGTPVGAVSSYTFSNVTSNHVISASFSLAPPPSEVANSLTVSPQYVNGATTYVPGSFNIAENFTSAAFVNACQYTINNGVSWSPGVVNGTGPYTCAASGVTAADGTALTILMKASNAGGWSTPTASLARTVNLAGFNCPAGGSLSGFQSPQDFENAWWGKANCSVSADATTAPDGTATADKLMESSDTTNREHYLLAGSLTLADNTNYTVSVYAAAAGDSTFVLNPWNMAGTNYYGKFDLSAGTVISVTSGATATITPVANGFYRCTITFPSSTGTFTPGFAFILLNSSGVSVYPGNGASGVYLWGAQLEPGIDAGAYLPTECGAPSPGSCPSGYIYNSTAEDCQVPPSW